MGRHRALPRDRGLTRQDRAAVDAAVAEQLGTVSHQRLVGTAREHSYRLDPAAVTAWRARAESA